MVAAASRKIRYPTCSPSFDSLALEYARRADLSAFLRRGNRTSTDAAARREIAGVVEVLAKLHRGQLPHRDLTPMLAGGQGRITGIR